MEKVTRLNLEDNRLTNVKGLEKLTQLKTLYLDDNPDLTKAQIEKLWKVFGGSTPQAKTRKLRALVDLYLKGKISSEEYLRRRELILGGTTPQAKD